MSAIGGVNMRSWSVVAPGVRGDFAGEGLLVLLSRLAAFLNPSPCSSRGGLRRGLDGRSRPASGS